MIIILFLHGLLFVLSDIVTIDTSGLQRLIATVTLLLIIGTYIFYKINKHIVYGVIEALENTKEQMITNK